MTVNIIQKPCSDKPFFVSVQSFTYGSGLILMTWPMRMLDLSPSVWKLKES